MECSFADLLQQTIERDRAGDAGRASHRRTPPPDPGEPAWTWLWSRAADLPGFEDPRRASQRNGTFGGVWPAPDAEQPPPGPRPRRRLTPEQRDSMRFFRHLGETWLRDDATADEVKRAYRALARRLHPDAAAQHPVATPHSFVQLRRHYDVLAAMTAR